MKKLFLFLGVLLAGCTGVPEGITVVDGFSLDRYLGTWYEIARIDNSFEKNLGQVSAAYTLREDGRVRVVNRGYDARKGEWRSIEGRASFAGDTGRGGAEGLLFRAVLRKLQRGRPRQGELCLGSGVQ